MLQPINNPPTPAWRFELAGVRFVRDNDEPFIWRAADGTADLDMKAQHRGFVNRILRYAIANEMPVDEQDISRAVYNNIAAYHRQNYFSGGVAHRAARTPGKLPRYHTAPVPPGLMEAARRVAGADVDAEESVIFLHELDAGEWYRTMDDWKRHDEDPKDPLRFGPIWWYAIHTLGITKKSDGYHEVKSWINLWHSSIPCKECRVHFKSFPIHPPYSWNGLKVWAGQAHDWVSANINT